VNYQWIQGVKVTDDSDFEVTIFMLAIIGLFYLRRNVDAFYISDYLPFLSVYFLNDGNRFCLLFANI
jgi:hypothetical protein